MKRPSLLGISFGLVPFTAICLAVPLWDRIYPMIFGLPFNFFWLILWILLTPAFLWLAYRVETAPEDSSARKKSDQS